MIIEKPENFESLKNAADQGDVKAQSKIGDYYDLQADELTPEEGDVEPYRKLARHYLTLAAEQNDPEAQYRLASIYHFEDNDYQRAFEKYRLAADQGRSGALQMIYDMYQVLRDKIDERLYSQFEEGAQQALSVVFKANAVETNIVADEMVAREIFDYLKDHAYVYGAQPKPAVS